MAIELSSKLAIYYLLFYYVIITWSFLDFVPYPCKPGKRLSKEQQKSERSTHFFESK